MAQGDKRRALLFCRPYLVPDFRANFAPLADRYEFSLLTDGRRVGEDDTREAFYRHLDAGTRPTGLTDEQVADCIARCRLLRNLTRVEAIARLGAMSAALTEWLDRLRPDIVITHLIDEYVLHTLAMLARARNIPVLAYCSSYFPGYAQFYRDERGRPFEFRRAAADEAVTIIETITRKSFRQDYGNNKSYSLPHHVYRVGRYYAKRAYFIAKGLIERDPLQIHYAVTPYIAERRSLFSYAPATLFHADWRQRIAAQKSGAVYFPLGYFPESTTDYWITNTSILDYDEKILEAVAHLAQRYCVVIKEHPHMMGVRSPSLYHRLRAVPGVILVPPLDYSSQVMECAQAVIIGGGSGGVEATLAGMPLFTFCDTSYWFAASGAVPLDLDDTEGWPEMIARAIEAFQPMSPEQHLDFVTQCLSSTLDVRPGGKIWPLLDPAQLGDALDLCFAEGAAVRHSAHV